MSTANRSTIIRSGDINCYILLETNNLFPFSNRFLLSCYKLRRMPTTCHWVVITGKADMGVGKEKACRKFSRPYQLIPISHVI